MIKIRLSDYSKEKVIYLGNSSMVYFMDGCLYDNKLNYLNIYYNTDEELWFYEDQYWSKLTIEFVPILSEELID